MRTVLLALVAVLAAAIIGGVVGGLIVRETSSSGNGGSAGTTRPGSSVCPAKSVANEALPSVVTVQASHGQAGGTGSGVVIRAGGYVLTNNHVISVAANGGTVSILRSDGETTDATIVGRDPLTDLAVIKANAPSQLPAIALGESD
ncbi:MAG TPA: trypsin-like peptidase domain-containing protein, partial [Solirubrobacteraceae bacterium]|nr:trypsin-like peptidase domain-containing protein [Solirubrobacteraceae bacterium]